MRQKVSFAKFAIKSPELRTIALEGAIRSIKNMLAEEILHLSSDLTSDPNFLITLNNSRRMAAFCKKWEATLAHVMLRALIVSDGRDYNQCQKVFAKRQCPYHPAMLADLRPIFSAIAREYTIEKNKKEEKTFLLPTKGASS